MCLLATPVIVSTQAAALGASEPASLEEEWFPAEVPVLDASNTATDMRAWLDAPAGKRGWVGVREGHFHFADGTRARFWGTNLTFDGALPPPDKAGAVAARLAKLGYNLVRLHHLDTLAPPRGIIDYARGRSTELHEESLVRLDHLVAALAKQGIYYNLNLHVGRRYSVADGLPAPLSKHQKFATNFVEPLLVLQEEMASKLLGRINTASGRRYADDPALALVELSNESSMFSGLVSGAFDPGGPQALPPPYQELYQKRWIEWLRQRYQNDRALREAWGSKGQRQSESLEAGNVQAPTKRGLRLMNRARLADSLRFLTEVQIQAHERLATHLRGLGLRVPITGTQHYDVAPGLNAQARLDYVDTHGYWNAPRGRGREQRIEPDLSMVGNPDLHQSGMRIGTSAPIPRWALSKVQGKPLTISEWNHCWPDPHNYELIPLAAAYGDYHDWDGLMHFAYAQTNELLLEPGILANSFHSSRSAVATVLMPIAALIFHRGDLATDPEPLSLHYDPRTLYEGVDKYLTSEQRYWWGKQVPWEIGLTRRVERVFGPGGSDPAPPPSDPLPRLQTTTGEILWQWDRRSHRGQASIRAGRVAGVIGSLAHQSLEAGPLRVDSAVDGTIIAISLTGQTLEESSRILLATVSSERNRGQRMHQGRIEELGSAPVETRLMRGSIRLRRAPEAPRLQVQALDLRGAPQAPITVTRDGNVLRVPLGEFPAMQYLLEAPRSP